MEPTVGLRADLARVKRQRATVQADMSALRSRLAAKEEELRAVQQAEAELAQSVTELRGMGEVMGDESEGEEGAAAAPEAEKMPLDATSEALLFGSDEKAALTEWLKAEEEKALETLPVVTMGMKEKSEVETETQGDQDWVHPADYESTEGEVIPETTLLAVVGEETQGPTDDSSTPPHNSPEVPPHPFTDVVNRAGDQAIQRRILDVRERSVQEVVHVLNTGVSLDMYNTCHVSTALHALGAAVSKQSNGTTDDQLSTVVRRLFEVGSSRPPLEIQPISVNSALTGVYRGNLARLAPDAWLGYATKCLDAASANLTKYKVWELASVVDLALKLRLPVTPSLTTFFQHVARYVIDARTLLYDNEKENETSLCKLANAFLKVRDIPRAEMALVRIVDAILQLRNVYRFLHLIVDILHHLAEVKSTAFLTDTALSRLEGVVGREVDKLSALECVKLVWALATFQLPRPRMYTAVANMLLHPPSRLPQVDSTRLPLLVWSYAFVCPAVPALFDAVASDLLSGRRNLDAFSDHGLADLAWSFGSVLDQVEPGLLEGVFHGLAGAVTRRTDHVVKDWPGGVLTRMAFGFSVSGVAGLSNTFGVLLEGIRAKQDQLSTGELVLVLLAAGNMCMVNEAWLSTELVTTLTMREAVEPLGACALRDTCWALMCLGALGQPVVQAFFLVERTHVDLFPSAVNGDGVHRWRCVVEAWKQVVGPVPRGSLLDRVVSTALVEERVATLPPKSTDAVVNDVLRVLQSMGEGHVSLASPRGSVVVDILVRSRKGEAVGIAVVEMPFLAASLPVVNMLKQSALAASNNVQRVEVVSVGEWKKAAGDVRKTMLLRRLVE